jgi:hypothetical protein
MRKHSARGLDDMLRIPAQWAMGGMSLTGKANEIQIPLNLPFYSVVNHSKRASSQAVMLRANAVTEPRYSGPFSWQ